ncbi:FmdB family zinc ribbon protein [Oryzobacter terrae]|uniref:FmdB family zinc ribbon protein n=1 Tax=Oryzobacter terrae TaxID=1620385 RepID=UPI00366D9E23
MPTYAYACTECDHRFEVVQSFSDDSLTVCPECEGRLRKLFNAVGIVFKGGGFYRTDSRSGAAVPSGSSGSSGSGSGSSDGGSSTGSSGSSSSGEGSSTSSGSSGSSGSNGSSGSTGSSGSSTGPAPAAASSTRSA